MPHLVLEYSSNVVEQNKFSELFSVLHQLLAQKLPTQITSCKSRAYEAKHYYVSDGNPNNAFIALSIHIMPGRSVELLQALNAEIMTTLQNYFAASSKRLNLQISIEITELSQFYLKT